MTELQILNECQTRPKSLNGISLEELSRQQRDGGELDLKEGQEGT
jgi:hypothetical protein